VDGKLLWVNPAVERITGYSVGECMAMPGFPTPIIAEADRDAVARQIGEAVQGSSRNDFEFRVRHKDGRLVWVAASWQPIYDSRGSRLGHRSSIRDIAERKRAENALRQSEAYLAEAQRLSHTGSWAFDVARAEYVYLSEECLRIFGADPPEPPLTKETLFRRAHPEDRDRLKASHEKSLRERVDTAVEFRLVMADGTVKHLYSVRHPVVNDAGEVVRLLGTTIDATERKRAEAEHDRLRQLETDLAHINRVSMLGELAASIAHEVGQPLACVVSDGSACLRWLDREVPNLEEARDAARRVIRDGKRAGEIIARIRALTKKAVTPDEKLTLNETIQDVLALVGDEAQRRSVLIRPRFAAELPAVAADRVQMQQVVLNLVMNGVEAMSGVADRPRELVITTRSVEPDEVQVTVEDAGTGLDPAAMDRIFDPFFTTKPSGMGMGLSICRSILQAHGGRLWATAREGPGAAFHFTLPRYREEASQS
jgi:PAS domain S-box-containing protein